MKYFVDIFVYFKFNFDNRWVLTCFLRCWFRVIFNAIVEPKNLDFKCIKLVFGENFLDQLTSKLLIPFPEF